jgi:hypothetical protein
VPGRGHLRYRAFSRPLAVGDRLHILDSCWWSCTFPGMRRALYLASWIVPAAARGARRMRTPDEPGGRSLQHDAASALTVLPAMHDVEPVSSPRTLSRTKSTGERLHFMHAHIHAQRSSDMTWIGRFPLVQPVGRVGIEPTT